MWRNTMGGLLYVLALLLLTNVAVTNAGSDDTCCLPQADIVFLVDGSGSIGASDFIKLKNFVKGIVGKLDVGPNKFHVGLMQFSDYPSREFTLNQYNTTQDVMAGIDHMNYMGGGTYTSDAIKQMRQQLFAQSSGARPNVPRICVVITDGQSSDPAHTGTEANNARSDHIGMIAIGVGSDIDINELHAIADDPDSSNTFMVSTYNHLDAIATQLVNRACQDPSEMDDVPAWCFTPTGDTCDWYTQCLEVRHPCDGDPDSYATTYANKFCNLYTAKYDRFSTIGQAWIDGVRKCLHVQLLPILDQCISCKKVKEFAFKSHTPCYLKASPTSPSICDLGPFDWAQVFWTIKSGFVQVWLPSLNGLLDVGFGCGKTYMDAIMDYKSEKVEQGMQFLKLMIEKAHQRIGKRSVPESGDDAGLASSLADQIAAKMNWGQAGVLWHGFINNDTSTNLDTAIPVTIMIAAKAEYDVNADLNVPTPNLNQIINDVTTAVENGDLKLSLDGDKSFTRFIVCEDVECETVIHDIVPPTSTASVVKKSMGYIMTFTIVAISTIRFM